MHVILVVLSCLIVAGTSAQAQDSTFEPPRPPGLDGGSDFEEIDDELMEDDGFRPPPPPPPPGSGMNQGGPPPADFRPAPSPGASGGGNFGAAKAEKFKFKIVENEFWERGKKRGRGKKIHAP